MISCALIRLSTHDKPEIGDNEMLKIASTTNIYIDSGKATIYVVYCYNTPGRMFLSDFDNSTEYAGQFIYHGIWNATAAECLEHWRKLKNELAKEESETLKTTLGA